MRKLARFFVNILLVVVSIFGTLFILDVLLHFTTMQYKYTSPQAPQGYFRYDSELGYDITPNFATSTHTFSDFRYPIWSNALGCFDYEYDGSAPYIYVGGDSMAWGFAPLDDKWGKGIQHLLGIRTLTCGENGYGTRQEVIKARRVLAQLPEPPKIIVVSSFNNDVGDDLVFPNYNVLDGYIVFGQGQCGPARLSHLSALEATTTCTVSPIHYAPFQKLKFELGLHSVLYSMFTQTFGKKLKSALQPYKDSLSWLSPVFPWLVPPPPTAEEKNIQTQQSDTDLVWQFHEGNFLAFKKLADSYHAKLVVVLIPDDESMAATSSNPSWYNEKIAAFLSSARIDHLNLWQDFHDRTKPGQRAFYWPINGHINIAGNRLTGLLVTKYILEHNLIEESNKNAILEKITTELANNFPLTAH